MKKQNSIILSLVAIIAVLGAGIFTTMNVDAKETVLIGSSLPDYTLEYLAENTPYAISGVVIDMIPVDEQTDELGITDVFTNVVIDVTKDISAQYTEDTITVRIFGGETDTRIYQYEHSAEFAIGEKVLILVAEKEPQSIFGDNYYVAGLQHGKYNLDEDGTAKNKNSDRDMSEKSLEDKIKEIKQITEVKQTQNDRD